MTRSCPTGKVRYRTEAKANSAALQQITTRKLDAYLCTRCMGWHLTTHHD